MQEHRLDSCIYSFWHHKTIKKQSLLYYFEWKCNFVIKESSPKIKRLSPVNLNFSAFKKFGSVLVPTYLKKRLNGIEEITSKTTNNPKAKTPKDLEKKFCSSTLQPEAWKAFLPLTCKSVKFELASRAKGRAELAQLKPSAGQRGTEELAARPLGGTKPLWHELHKLLSCLQTSSSSARQQLRGSQLEGRAPRRASFPAPAWRVSEQNERWTGTSLVMERGGSSPAAAPAVLVSMSVGNSSRTDQPPERRAFPRETHRRRN